MKFVDGTRAYQILVLNHEGLVTAAVLLVQFHHEGKMMEQIRKGVEPAEAMAKNTSTYGRFAEGVKFIDPRAE